MPPATNVECEAKLRETLPEEMRDEFDALIEERDDLIAERDDLHNQLKSIPDIDEDQFNEMRDVLTTVKYWLHDALVLNKPMLRDPRIVLRQVEEAVRE